MPVERDTVKDYSLGEVNFLWRPLLSIVTLTKVGVQLWVFAK